MHDSRVTIWTNPTTINADGATNGATLDLLADYTGSHLYSTSLYGIPVMVMAYDINTGTGDGFTLTFKAQESDDESTWYDLKPLGVITIDTNGYFVVNGTSRADKTRAKLTGRIKATKRYVRIVCTAAGITGGETAKVKAFVTDGTNTFNDGAVL